MRRVAKVCNYCQQACFQFPCEHCGKPERRKVQEVRQSSTERGYGWRWRKWRESLIKRMRSRGEWNGTCDRCGKAILGSIHCDHIEPVQSKEDPKFYDRTNIQFLHEACHSEKTAEDKRLGKVRR